MRKPYIRNDIYPRVIRYSYPIKNFSGIDAFSKEESLALNYGKYGYNISINNGILSKGIGIGVPDFGDKIFPSVQNNFHVIDQMFFYKHFDNVNKVKDERVIIYMNDSNFYEAKLGSVGFTEIVGYNFTSDTVSFANYSYNGNDCLILAGRRKNELIIYDTVKVENCSLPYGFSDICVHNERVFGVETDSSTIHFTAPLDPKNWTESLSAGGHIVVADEGGVIKRIISYKDSLYIFKEYAIYRLTTYGAQTDFTLCKIFSSNNLIYDATITVCNDKILFVADDGFYTFDGYNCAKILKGIFPMLTDKTYIHACYFNHKYYLACKIATDGVVIADEIDNVAWPTKNNSIISYDLSNGGLDILRGADIRGFMPVSLANMNRLFVNFYNYDKKNRIGQITETGKFFDTILPKKWQSVITDFELLNKDKVLRRIYLNTDSNLNITTHINGDTKHEISASSVGNPMVVVNKRADKVGFTLTSLDENFSVRGALFEFDVIRRNVNE